MPLVTFTTSGKFNASEKKELSQIMLQAQVAAGFAKEDLFHRIFELKPDHLLVDPHYPDYLKARTDRFVMIEIAISAGRSPATAEKIAEVAVHLFRERLGIEPPDVMFVFYEIDPRLPRFPSPIVESSSVA